MDNKMTFTVPQAAELLGISRALAYELVARHQLPALRLGRRLVIPAEPSKPSSTPTTHKCDFDVRCGLVY